MALDVGQNGAMTVVNHNIVVLDPGTGGQGRIFSGEQLFIGCLHLRQPPSWPSKSDEFRKQSR